MKKSQLKDQLREGLESKQRVTIFDSVPMPTPEPAAIPDQIVYAEVAHVSAQSTLANHSYIGKPHPVEAKENLSVVLTPSQRDSAEVFARKVQRNGMKKKSRITTNTVIRSLIELLGDFEGDISEVTDEEGLLKSFRDFYLGKRQYN